MGKKRDMVDSEEPGLFQAEESPLHKKHKKHKKHKHKKKHQEEEDDEESFVEVESLDEPVKPIKLKIKLGGQTLETKGVGHPVSSEDGSGDPLQLAKKKKNKDDDDTSDEERAWLDALEKGTLDDNGEVKKSKDIKLLTSRQKALLHGMKEETLLELPSGYKSIEITEEQMQKRQQRAKKRREQAQEKREKDKKQTLDRLLKKQDVKSKRGRNARRGQGAGFVYRYINNQSVISLCIPHGAALPFQSTHNNRFPPCKQKCGVEDCINDKRYSCSKTGVPLCSLECYKKNQEIYKNSLLIS